MFHFRLLLVPITRIVLILSVLAVSSTAEAHVKWFSPYSVKDTPTAIHQLITMPMFWVFWAGITSVMIISILLERTSLAEKLTDGLNTLTTGMRRRSDDMMRVGMGTFLVALWVMGSIILTPELKTDRVWVSWLQLGMALALFWRISMPLTAIGILFLWGFAVSQYGLFHLLDYPIFLGIAIYFVISAWPRGVAFPYRWDVLRWGAAITLMWASVEKFAYPEWSFPILEAMPFLTLGLSNANFMILSGLAEFALAFALIWTPLVRRLSAVLLCILFTAAVIPFGKIDAIGHLMIILILVGIILDDRPLSPRSRPLRTLIPLKSASLVGFVLAFYGLQAAFYGGVVATSAELSQANIHASSMRSETPATLNAATLRLKAEHPDLTLRVWREH